MKRKIQKAKRATLLKVYRLKRKILKVQKEITRPFDFEFSFDDSDI